MTSTTPWTRANRANPCPICHRPDWCSTSGDGAVTICMRIGDGAQSQTRNGGYLHRLAERPFARRAGAVRTAIVGPALPTRNDLPTLAANYKSAVNPARQDRLAAALGVSVESLIRLGVGWSFDCGRDGQPHAAGGAWAFPMTNAGGRVLGIRLRLENGRKFAVTGGREGLFIPTDLPDAPTTLFITEGATDCAALLDLGLAAVGRSSCTGGTKLLVELVSTRRPGRVVILADADEPGQRGAGALASVVCAYVRDVRVVTPPPGVKDARAWKLNGATAADVEDAVQATPARRLTVRSRSSASKGVANAA
jgi:5S rRNA maturation endonuclease (ribonuclease M5)